LALPNVVLSAEPFHCTTALPSKPEPLTVNGKVAPPTLAELGLIEVTWGFAVTVNVAPFDVAPLSDTVTVFMPGVVRSMAGIVAVNTVELVDPIVSGEPFHRTIAAESKPVPLTVSKVAGLPAGAPVGLIELIEGGAMMVKVTPFEISPVSIFVTVTVAEPGVEMRPDGTLAVN